MKQALINFVKKILPQTLVDKVKAWRKKNRQQTRLAINNGKDILVDILVGDKKFSIYVNPFLNGGVDDEIYKLGKWEPEISAVIEKYLPEGGIFLDIGANIGYHTLYAALIVGNKGKVFSFEPLPRLSKQIKKSLEVNRIDNVRIYETALSDKVGQADLSLVSENIGASSIKTIEHERIVDDKVLVEVNKLDNFTKTIEKLDVIKIDIEGNEVEALRGSKELLQKFKPVIILEFSPNIYEQDFSGKTKDLYNFLKSFGYKITVIDNNNINLEEKINYGDFKDLHTNLLCLIP
ncbi:MAG: FkbM family methyltransferase [Candidatus Paceibacterota bacterium]